MFQLRNDERAKAVPITCCPICGGHLSDESKWDMATRTFSANGMAVRLTPREASIFNPIWLARSKGGVVSRERLSELAFADEVEGGPLSYNSISVNLAHIRLKLAVTGYTVTKSVGSALQPYRVAQIGKPVMGVAE